MSDNIKGIEPMVHNSRINIPYSWWAGDTASKFFISLRDVQVIIAPRCARCGKVFMPPRKVCPSCFTENTAWVKLSGEGMLVSFSVARRQLESIPKGKKAPVIWGLIKLDGADSALLHYLDGVKPEDVTIGMRVRAVFADTRKGTIHDIAHFAPVK